MKLPSSQEGEIGSVNRNNGVNQQSGEPDFSEFLWMENEEEFDQQVIRELEEEDMINYYYELYEENIQQGGSGHVGHIQMNYNIISDNNGTINNQNGQGSNGGISTEDNVIINNEINNRDNDYLSNEFNRALSFQSRLNPNAAEFVPRGNQQLNNVVIPTSSIMGEHQISTLPTTSAQQQFRSTSDTHVPPKENDIGTIMLGNNADGGNESTSHNNPSLVMPDSSHLTLLNGRGNNGGSVSQNENQLN